MIDQLHDSIDADCSEYQPLISNKEEWIAIHRSGKYLKEILDYYSEQWTKEVEITNSRNQWLKELRESLQGFENKGIEV